MTSLRSVQPAVCRLWSFTCDLQVSSSYLLQLGSNQNNILFYAGGPFCPTDSRSGATLPALLSIICKSCDHTLEVGPHAITSHASIQLGFNAIACVREHLSYQKWIQTGKIRTSICRCQSAQPVRYANQSFNCGQGTICNLQGVHMRYLAALARSDTLSCICF